MVVILPIDGIQEALPQTIEGGYKVVRSMDNNTLLNVFISLDIEAS